CRSTCTKVAVIASISKAGRGRAGIAAASHGAAVWGGAAFTAGTAGVTDPMSAGIITRAIGKITAVAIASEASPARRAASPALRHARAPAPRRVLKATPAYGARPVRVTAACEARPAAAEPMCSPAAARKYRAAETRPRQAAAAAPVLAAAPAAKRNSSA